MIENSKRRKTKRRGAKRKHIAGRAYYGDTDHCGSKVISKWQSARITHQTGPVGFEKALWGSKKLLTLPNTKNKPRIRL